LIKDVKKQFKRNKNMRIFFRKVVKATYKKDTLTIFYKNGTKERYKGECTVWHALPYMKSCDTILDGKLYEIWKYIQNYGNPYPLAHKTKT
jgi:hypothetical protein